MPIYEYTCRKCGHHFDHLARTLSDKPKACPSCKSTSLEKGFSSFAVSAGSQSQAAACDSCAGSCPGTQGPCAGGSCPLV